MKNLKIHEEGNNSSKFRNAILPKSSMGKIKGGTTGQSSSESSIFCVTCLTLGIVGEEQLPTQG